MSKVKYKLGDLSGPEGNAFAIMGYVQNCMRLEGKTKQELEAYYNEATEDDYDRLVFVSREMLNELNNPTE